MKIHPVVPTKCHPLGAFTYVFMWEKRGLLLAPISKFITHFEISALSSTILQNVKSYNFEASQVFPILWLPMYYILSSLFLRVVLPTQEDHFLPTLGEPPVKSEWTTNSIKSWNGTGLTHPNIVSNMHCPLYFDMLKLLKLLFILQYHNT